MMRAPLLPALSVTMPLDGLEGLQWHERCSTTKAG